MKITFSLNGVSQSLDADYDQTTKKFGQRSGNSIVPLRFVAPGSGSVSVYPVASYLTPLGPPPIVIVGTANVVMVP